MKCWMGRWIYLGPPLLCFLPEQKPANRSSWTAGCSGWRRTPKGSAVWSSCGENTSGHKLLSKKVCCRLPHRPRELQKNTFLPQQRRSSMSTRQRSGSLWTRHPEARSSTVKPSGGVLRNSSSGVTVTLLRFIFSTIRATLFFLLLSVLQSFPVTISELQRNARQMLLCIFYTSTSCEILQNKTA